MVKSLTQQEINAMLRTVRGINATAGPEPERSVQTWNVRATGKLGADQARAIQLLHQGLARNLSNSMGAYMRNAFEVALTSADQLEYSEFLGSMSEMPYMVLLHVHPYNVMAALEIDRCLIFPMVDVLLGGNGDAQTIRRDITEIEENIMEDVVRIVCRELESAWQSLGASIEIGKRQQQTQIQQFLPANGKALVLGFEVTMPQMHGQMNILLPASMSNTMLRKLSRDVSHLRPMASPGTDLRMRELLLDCPLEAELAICQVKLRLVDLVKLQPGTVLNMRRPVKSPVSLMIAGNEVFAATPVRSGTRRAAQLGERLQPLSGNHTTDRGN